MQAGAVHPLSVPAPRVGAVALALVAQLDELGGTFMSFALVVLPALVVLGLTSYMRLADLAVQDAHHARAVGRIRAFHLTLDPAGRQYWMQPAGDDPHAIVGQAGEQHTRWHHFSHTATAVAAVTAVISGALLDLVLSASSPRSEPTRFLADGSPARPVEVAEPTSRQPLPVPAVAWPRCADSARTERRKPAVARSTQTPRRISDHPKEVDDMAASLNIEEESGSYYPRPRHPHNGYYAGDFSGQPLRLLTFRDGQYHTTIVRSAS